ncbi:MAG: hypothetical protein K0R09_3563 [Clostridiales bacterium]|jgi:putative NADH-flavin reductase|nr:hypothetical protein [Clostridiales bacterium]
MNILILGATGRVGNAILNFSLMDEHKVTILVRSPEKVTITNEDLTVLKGNVLNQEDLSKAMDGQDVVISALNTDDASTLSESMPLIIDSMKKAGINRIITIGTGGILQSRVEPHLLRYESSESKRKTKTAAMDHHKAFNILEQSDLDWTIVCPTYLPDGDLTGKYRVVRDILPEGGVKISVHDTADFAFKQLKSSEFIKSRVGIAY